MNSNAHFEIARTFRRVDTSLPKTHPLRGSMMNKTGMNRIEREPILYFDIAGEARMGRNRLIRDVLISIMGIVSAVIPMAIAIQTVMGA
jgi:hypothetical protein